MSKISDPFLEREKELMKLNDSINTKISLDFKTPTKSANRKNMKSKKAQFKASKIDTKPIKGWWPSETDKANTVYGGVKIQDSMKSINGLIESVPSPMQHEIDDSSKRNYCMEGFVEDDTIKFNGSSKDSDRLPSDKTLSQRIGNVLSKFGENAEQNQADGLVVTETPNAKRTNDELQANLSGISLIPNNLARRNVSSEGLIKFLKAKVTILQQELGLSHKENTTNLDNLAKAMDQLKKSDAVRDQTTNKINCLKSQIQKMEQQIANVDIKLKEKDSIQQSLRKECDELKSKLKTVQQTNAALETRLHKCQEDLEYVRKNFHAAKSGEKEMQLSLQHERKFYENQLKINQKQRNDLMSALKKHLLLLDNLKRQNACLEQAKVVQMTENEFLKILEWNADGNTKK